MPKPAPKSGDSADSMATSFSDFKVVKQTTLNSVQKKTTCEELANPLPIARTTMEKLKRFKFKAKRSAESDQSNPKEQSIAFKVRSEDDGEHTAKRRRIDDSQGSSFTGELQSSQWSNRSGGFEATSDAASHFAKSKVISEDEYMAGDEAEPGSVSPVPLDEDMNHSVNGNLVSAIEPPRMANPPRNIAIMQKGRVKTAESSTSQTQENTSVDPKFLKEPETWNKKSSYFSADKIHSKKEEFLGMPAINFKEHDDNDDDEEEEDYGGWDEDMDSLIAAERLPGGNADTEAASVLDDDYNDYGGWDHDMEEEVINNPQIAEAGSEKSLTELSFPVSKLKIGGAPNNSSDEFDVDEDMDEELMSIDLDAARRAIRQQSDDYHARNDPLAQPPETDDYYDWMSTLFGVDDLKEQTKAPVPLRKPKIIKEIISMEDKLYSYKPVEEGRPAETIITRRWSLMPASAFETTQQNQPVGNTNQLQPQHIGNQVKSSLDCPSSMARRVTSQHTTPPQSSPPPVHQSEPQEVRGYRIPPNAKVVDLTSDKLPLSPESPVLTRQSMKSWISKSEPDILGGRPPDQQTTHFVDDIRAEEMADIKEEEEKEEEEVEESPLKRSKQARVSIDDYDDLADYSGDERPKWNKSDSRAVAVDKNWDFGKKANDVYPNNRYTNAKYIPNHIVKRYVDIISAPPADYLLQPKIVDTRPPPEKPMVPIGVKPMKFFSLEKLKDAYYNKGLHNSGAIKVYVRIVKFESIANRTYNVQMGIELLLSINHSICPPREYIRLIRRIVYIVELYKNSVAIDGSMPSGRMSTRQLMWLKDVGNDNKGQTALVTGFITTRDGNPFLDITEMRERTWPEIADDSIKAAMNT